MMLPIQKLKTRAAFLLIASQCWAHVNEYQERALNGDPEGLHKMRVGVRRLRATLATFNRALTQVEFLRSELRWIQGVLGTCRDWDVFIQKNVRPITNLLKDEEPALRAFA